MADTHKVAKTKVVQLENGAYGVEFEFDDGHKQTQPFSFDHSVGAHN